MKTKRFVSALVLFTACVTPNSATESRAGAAWLTPPAALSARPDAEPIAPLDFHVPKIATVTLDNGLIVYAVEDPTAQLVSLSLLMPGGAIYDPSDAVGLAGLAAALVRAGGAGDRSADALDDALDFIGANVESGAGAETIRVDASALARDFSTLTKLFADVVLRPRFEEARLTQAKDEAAESIRRRNDDPGTIAARLFSKAVYGEKSPWAREPSERSIAALSRAQIVDWHRRVFFPSGARLVIAGPLPSAELVLAAQNIFGAWKGKATLPTLPPIDRHLSRRVILVPRPFAQARVRFGHLGIRRLDTDESAVGLGNSVLGAGGFTSRLMREIRSNRGLAYGVGSSLSAGRDRGLFLVSMGVEPEKTGEALDTSLALVDQFAKAPAFTSEELARAKDSAINSFAFRFDTPERAASERSMLDFWGYPQDYLERYRDRIAALTDDEVSSAARTHVHPDELQIVVVGDPKRLGDLSRFGPLTVVKDPENAGLE